MQVQIRLNENEIQHWLTEKNFDENKDDDNDDDDDDDDAINNNNLYVGLYVQAIYDNENIVIYLGDVNNSRIKNVRNYFILFYLFN